MTKRSTPFSPEVRERGADGVGPAGRARLAIWGDPLDRDQDRLHGQDAAQLGGPTRVGRRSAGRPDNGRARADRHHGQTRYGSATSFISRPGSASSTWPSSSMPSLVASSAGGRRGPAMPASCSMPWSRLCMNAGPCRAAASCITATEEASTCPFATRSGWRRRASSPRSAASATLTTTPCDNALAETINGLFKAEVISTEGRGSPSRRSSSPPSNGSIGSTRLGSSSQSATCLLPRPKRATLPRPRCKPWPHDPNQTASGKPRAAHRDSRPAAEVCGGERQRRPPRPRVTSGSVRPTVPSRSEASH